MPMEADPSRADETNRVNENYKPVFYRNIHFKFIFGPNRKARDIEDIELPKGEDRPL